MAKRRSSYFLLSLAAGTLASEVALSGCSSNGGFIQPGRPPAGQAGSEPSVGGAPSGGGQLGDEGGYVGVIRPGNVAGDAGQPPGGSGPCGGGPCGVIIQPGHAGTAGTDLAAGAAGEAGATS